MHRYLINQLGKFHTRPTPFVYIFDKAPPTHSFAPLLNSNWDVSSVASLAQMFANCTSFNQPLNDWNTFSATTFFAMFYEASAFNQDLNHWDTSSITDMAAMFYSASKFNGNVTTWDTSNVDMLYMAFTEALM